MNARIATPDVDALAIDFADLDTPPSALSDAYRPRNERDPWLARRTLTWGGSEVAPLLVAYGLDPMAATPGGWVTDMSEQYQRLGLPKIIAWKAGLRPRSKGDVASMDQGNNRERELLGRFKRNLARYRVRPESIRHADSVPKEWMPIVDRQCPQLAVTPDSWARWLSGSLCNIQIKCTYKPCPVLQWHHYVQAEAEIGATGATGGIVLVGDQWVKSTDKDGNVIPSPDGPVRAFVIPSDENAIELVRVVVREAWSLVEDLHAIVLHLDALADDPSNWTKGGAKTASHQRAVKDAAARCAELWQASHERMRVHRDPTRVALEAALAEVEGLDDVTDYAA